MVILVGAVTHNKKHYWKLRNSWGSNWGDKGHFYLERDVNNEKYDPYKTMLGIGDFCYVTVSSLPKSTQSHANKMH